MGELKNVGTTPNSDYTIDDEDILIVTPRPGTIDNPEISQINVDFQTNYALGTGKKCGLVVNLSNMLSQDADSRKIYAAGMKPEIFYGVALVVGNPLARAIGSFFIGLSKPPIPTTLFDSAENAIIWLKSIRPE
jgi:hypothetical protein